MTTSAPQWNASQVLHIDPYSTGFTCVGHAKTQGRRCRNIIAKDNRSLASKTLQNMSEQNVQTTKFDRQLESLAHRLLCRRWHVRDESQITAKVEQWKSNIARFRAEDSAPQARQPVIETETTTANVITTEPNLEDTLESLRREIATLNERYANALQLAAPSGTVSPRPSQPVHRVDSNLTVAVIRRSTQTEGRHNHIHSATTSRSSSIEPVEFEVIHPTTRQATPAEEEEIHDLSTRTSTSQTHSTESDPIPTPPLPEPETPTDVYASAHSSVEPPASNTSLLASTIESLETSLGGQTRRRIDGECSICCEDVADGRDVSWCKAQCGQNFHADCVGIWLATQEDDHRTETCPFW